MHLLTFSGAIIVNAARDFHHTRFRREIDSLSCKKHRERS
jgi:hypothetical protein